MLHADTDIISDPLRLARLRALHLLDTPAEPAFDRLTRLASRLLRTPIALVALIDAERTFLKSQTGLATLWDSIDVYCKQIVVMQEALIIRDAHQDAKMLGNDQSARTGAVAFVGIPLITSDKYTLGALCVIDTRPREWTDELVTTLEDLAQSVMTEIELRGELIERERAEAAQRKSEQRLQAVITSAPVIVYTVDQDGAITMTEGKGLEAINTVPNRLVGESVFEVYRDKPEVIEAVRKALGGSATTIQTMMDFPEGRVHYEAAISPLLDENNQAAGAIGVLVDITDRVLAEQTLERSVQRLTLLRRVDAELSETLDPDSVLTIAMDTALRASRAEHGFIGLIDGDKLQLLHAVGSYITGGVWDGTKGVVGRALQTRKPQLVVNPDSDPDFIQDIPNVRGQMAIPLVHREHLIGVLNLKTRKPELFTREAFEFLCLIASRVTIALDNAQLYQVSQKQLEELHQLYMRVSELEQLKTDMIRIAAHDLRNPLGVVTGYADMLLMPGDTLTEEDRSFVEAISKSGQKMVKIINDILSLQRIEAMQNQNYGEINLTDLIRDVAHSYGTRAEQKALHYQLDMTETPIRIKVDAGQIREAVDNLISNAIKYTPEQGTVTVRLKMEGERVLFEVQDTGFGIPPEQQERLFQPFFRASNAKASAIEGTGLGLHLVKNIIERHGGKMHFESTFGTGSTFGFELPISGGA